MWKYSIDLVAALIGLIHVYISLLESVLWATPLGRRIFRMSVAESKANQLLAFNQGFYNLFLAVAIFVGEYFARFDRRPDDRILVDYAVMSVLGAGCVLIGSAPRLRRAGLVQAVPAILYLALRLYGLK